MGAIVAVQRETGLKEYARTGRSVEAVLSADILGTIFAPQSPLHDGAVIIVGDSIKAAGAILPLTQNPVSDRSLGTRHRAAIGLSEETDAVVIVVSEETSRISVAHRGANRSRRHRRAAARYAGTVAAGTRGIAGGGVFGTAGS